MFLKYGLRSVSVDDICREMRISKKTFYTIFKSKEELVKALLEKGLEHRTKSKIELKEGETVIDHIRENGKKFLASQSLIEKHVVFFYDLEKYYPTLYNKYDARMKAIEHRQLVEIIELGQQEGVFRSNVNVEMAANVVGFAMKQVLTKIEGTTAAERMEEAESYIFRILIEN